MRNGFFHFSPIDLFNETNTRHHHLHPSCTRHLKFSRGLGGLNGVYYLAASNRWHDVERFMPVLDSLFATFGAEVVPDMLNSRYQYQYQTYRHIRLDTSYSPGARFSRSRGASILHDYCAIVVEY